MEKGQQNLGYIYIIGERVAGVDVQGIMRRRDYGNVEFKTVLLTRLRQQNGNLLVPNFVVIYRSDAPGPRTSRFWFGWLFQAILIGLRTSGLRQNFG